MGEQVSEVFSLAAELAEACGASRICDLPGCWEHRFDGWFVAINGHRVDTSASVGMMVPPFCAYVERGGVPCVLTSPREGTVMFGTEDEVIAALKAATKAARKGEHGGER